MGTTPGADPLAGVAALAREGDSDAQNQLVRAFFPRALGVARRILGARHPDIEDVTQEALLAVVRAMAGFREESSVMHYCTRIAVRTCLKHSRRRRAEQGKRADLEQRQVVEPPPSPAALALASRRREVLRELMDSLPEEQAETMGMRSVMGFSLEEVARATGAPVNTVRSRVRLAKKALSARIEADPGLRELLGGVS